MVSPFLLSPCCHLATPVVSPSRLRRLNRFLLALLATSTKQNHEPVSILAEIDPVTWAEVDFAFRGAWPTLTFLLRRTIRDHLRRSRPEKILNVFQRIHLRFFLACGLASGRTSSASSRTTMPDRLLDASPTPLTLDQLPPAN